MGRIRACSGHRVFATVAGRQGKLKHPSIVKNGSSRNYIEFELDSETLKRVEAIALEEGQSPFEVCVSLVREQLSRLRRLRGS
jgi:hypothetical protein